MEQDSCYLGREVNQVCGTFSVLPPPPRMLISGLLEVIKKNDIKKKKTSVSFWKKRRCWQAVPELTQNCGRMQVRFEAVLSNGLERNSAEKYKVLKYGGHFYGHRKTRSSLLSINLIP